MKLKKNFFAIFALFFFLAACSTAGDTTDIFELEDKGNLDITLTATADDQPIVIENGTELSLKQLSAIQIQAFDLDSQQSVNVYFNKTDARFPINESKKQPATLYTVVENYTPEDYPEFFILGNQTVKIFQYDAEPDTGKIPSYNKINAIKTISFTITEWFWVFYISNINAPYIYK